MNEGGPLRENVGYSRKETLDLQIKTPEFLNGFVF